MTQEYIIVSKTAIEERIKELEKLLNISLKANDSEFKRTAKELFEGQIIELKRVLSQSTPLTPEIEKVFEAGEKYGEQVSLRGNKQDYISNLKLDI